ncbi:MAG: hypothetical protein ACXV78_11530, partial [Candidatus Angelobacter sp.]
VAKVAKDPSATLLEKQTAVVMLLEQFPALLNAVRGLMGKKPSSDVRFPGDLENPQAAIVALRPAFQVAH